MNKGSYDIKLSQLSINDLYHIVSDPEVCDFLTKGGNSQARYRYVLDVKENGTITLSRYKNWLVNLIWRESITYSFIELSVCLIDKFSRHDGGKQVSDKKQKAVSKEAFKEWWESCMNRGHYNDAVVLLHCLYYLYYRSNHSVLGETSEGKGGHQDKDFMAQITGVLLQDSFGFAIFGKDGKFYSLK